jgi:hypothetical protein
VSRPAIGRVTRCILAAVVCATALTLATRSGAQETTDPVPPFDASASADAIRARLDVPGAPLTSRLVDVGAPTAQAAATSIGASRGYAAFPDPGELVQSAPGLVVGLLLQGAAGLPPISLPTLPTFPLLTVSDVNGNRHAELGEGPYSLRANSIANHSDAAASGGLQTGVAGNVASIRATAQAGVQDDGSVLATATSDVQGLTIGPLTIGRVTSTATATLAGDGTVEPTSSISISALRIGGIDVAINEKGLQLASVNVPLPIGDTLAALLSGAGLDVHFTTAQSFPNAVIAPTLVISTTVETGVGTAPGTMSVTLGGATATLTGPNAADAVTPVDDGVAAPDLGGAAVLDTPSLSTDTPTFGAPLPVPTGTPPAISAAPIGAERPGQLTGLFDIQSTYLALAGCAAGLYALGQIIRLLGVRWISTAG